MLKSVYNCICKPKYKTGFRRDVHDERDRYIKYTISCYENHVDLRNPENPCVFDQLSLESSTANAVCIAFKQIEMNKEFIPSRLFLYYNNKNGSIRDTLKSLATTGICSEKVYPYTRKRRPEHVHYVHAYFHKDIQYSRIYQIADQIEKCIAIDKYFIIFGIQIYDYWFHVKNDGKIRMPYSNDKPIKPHTLVICGFNKIKNRKYFIVQNSWGRNWGDNGFCYIPYNYILDRKLAWDFWVIFQSTFRLRMITE